jgi:hypothetical protein
VPVPLVSPESTAEVDTSLKNTNGRQKLHKLQWGTYFIIDGAASRVTKRRHDVVTFPLLT